MNCSIDGQTVRKFPQKVSRNLENGRISEIRTIQPKILEIPGAKSNRTGIFCNKFVNVSVSLAMLSPFPEIFQNAVPFANGNVWKLKPKCLLQWKAPSVSLATRKIATTLPAQ